MTVVGDIGQATGAWSPQSWDDALAHLPDRKPSQLVELTVNYRTPAEIMDVANRVLAVAAPHLQPPRSVRSGGQGPSVRRAPSEADLAATALAAAAHLRSEVGGTAAVIAPDSLAAVIDAAAGGTGEVVLEASLSVVPVGQVKGLEFDSVVVVEPELIAAESAQGLRALYVAMTRATKRLTIVHSSPLPAVLGLG
jgi:DNA helicase IV